MDFAPLIGQREGDVLKMLESNIRGGMLHIRQNKTGTSLWIKSRERSCPYAFLVPGSGVRVIGGRKFPKGKAAGRNASEPRRSLVTLIGEADPLV